MDNEVMPPPRFPPPPPPPPPPTWGRPEPSAWQKIKKLFAPIAVVGVLFLKFFAKLKFLILPVLKYFPVILKTGGTMFLTIGVYAMMWGVWFAAGFVLLILVHECGHLLAAKRLGLKVGAPVFILFMGAFIALKEAPRNAWIEAQVGIGCSVPSAQAPANSSTSPLAIKCSAHWPIPASSSISLTSCPLAFSTADAL
jgi:hypothetical protein